jgi:hypothetical protein
VITYRVTIEFPREQVAFTARLLLAGRRRRGFRADLHLADGPGARQGSWCLAAHRLPLRGPGDHVLAAQALELPQALERALAEGATFVILDGTVIPADRCRKKTRPWPPVGSPSARL